MLARTLTVRFYLFRPLAPGMYNVTAVMAGYHNRTVTVAVPADGSGETVELFLERPGLDALTNWGLARKFGPLREGTPGPVRPTPPMKHWHLFQLLRTDHMSDSVFQTTTQHHIQDTTEKVGNLNKEHPARRAGRCWTQKSPGNFSGFACDKPRVMADFCAAAALHMC